MLVVKLNTFTRGGYFVPFVTNIRVSIEHSQGDIYNA